MLDTEGKVFQGFDDRSILKGNIEISQAVYSVSQYRQEFHPLKG
ncbi:hypothetical protein [Nostoc sp.]